MPDVKWTMKAREFINCNCAYGCPCQFNAMPTHGSCQAVAGMEIESGHHGSTKLDGLRFVGFSAGPARYTRAGAKPRWSSTRGRPKPSVKRCFVYWVVRTPTRRNDIPGLFTTLEKFHDPIFAAIDFKVDVDARTGRLYVKGVTDGHGEPIKNPVTGAEHHARIDLPHGFEYAIAEVGRGWTKATGPIKFELADTHSHFANLHLTQSGVVH